MNESTAQPHEEVFETFARRASDALGDVIDGLLLFGSTASGETRGIGSDVDVFVVLNTENATTSYGTSLTIANSNMELWGQSI